MLGKVGDLEGKGFKLAASWRESSQSTEEIGIYLATRRKNQAVTRDFYEKLTNYVLEVYETEARFTPSLLTERKLVFKKMRTGGKPMIFTGEELLRRMLRRLEVSDEHGDMLLLALRSVADREKGLREKEATDKVCAVKEVYMVREQLKNMVVMIKDKNKEQLYVECPILFLERLKQNTDDQGIFKKVHKRGLVLGRIKKEWEDKGLGKYGPWLKGAIPYMYVIPKEKDPKNKTRLIASYFNHPLRRCSRR